MPIPIIYRSVTMLAAIQAMPTHHTFLRDRYFPTNPTTDIFPTEEVLVEYRDGSKKIAPFVAPRKGGITIARNGYTTKRYTPPFIAPQRALTIDDLNKKGFGENLYTSITPQQREASVLRQDLTELSEMIDGTEELICAKAMLENGYVLKHYVDEYGGANYEEFEIRFYDEASNPAKYTPAIKWNAEGAAIIEDLRAMIQMLVSRGLPATELVMASDVAATIINDPVIQKLLDIRNFNIGKIEALELPNGAAHIGTINVDGRPIKLITYDETYEDEAGVIKSYMPSGNVVLTAPAAGRGLYGAVTQLEQEDGSFHTYAAARVPKYTADAEAEIRKLKITARPLPIPNNKAPWVSSKVL